MLYSVIANMLGDSYMNLYKNDVALGPTTTLATMLANAATYTGYAPAHLTSWTAPTIDATNAAVTTTTQGQFTPTGAAGSGNLYGYFLTNSSNTAWYGCERFSGAPIAVNQGITLEVDCTYSLITRF